MRLHHRSVDRRRCARRRGIPDLAGRELTRLERELLRLYVEAEQYPAPREAFDDLVGNDIVVLDLLWAMCQVEP
jgi:hypothetical protein